MTEPQTEKNNERPKGAFWRRYFAPDGETIWDALWHLIWVAVVIRFLFFN